MTRPRRDMCFATAWVLAALLGCSSSDPPPPSDAAAPDAPGTSGACMTNGDCGVDGFCQLPLDTCGGTGTCYVPMPGGDCSSQQECGCDGVTYESPCLRVQAKVSRRSKGPCP